MPKQQYHCRRCGKEFFRYPSTVKDPENAYCSLGCANQLLGEQRICPACGTTFYAHRSAILRGEALYCSRGCSNPSRGRSRETNPNWKGGRFIRSDGYVAVLTPQGVYRLEHDVLMEEHLERRLAPGENIHHRNQQRADNRLDNLELTTTASHIKDHHPAQRNPGTWVELTCFGCGKRFKKRACEVRKTKAHFCNRVCYRNSVGVCATPVTGARGPSRLHLAIRSGLRSAGWNTLTHVQIGPWVVDEADVRQMLVLEVKGCYWHSCPECDLQGPSDNLVRDRAKTDYLRAKGWHLVEIWEHEWHQDPECCIQKIKAAWEPFVVGRKP